MLIMSCSIFLIPDLKCSLVTEHQYKIASCIQNFAQEYALHNFELRLVAQFDIF